MKSHIVHAYAFNLSFAQKLVADVPDEQMAVQPHPGMNHAAFVLGHLSSSADFGTTLLGQQRQLDKTWQSLFSPPAKPTTDRSAYPSKQVLLDTLAAQHDRLSELFKAATDAQLAAQMPYEKVRQRFPTIGDMFVFLLTGHESMHLGQVSAWRRAQGLPPVL